MNINNLFSLFSVVIVLSIECAPKSKHYLVKVGDNDNDDKNLEMMPADDKMGKSEDYEDTADRD